MEFISFSKTIFRKKDFQLATRDAKKVTVVFIRETDEDDLVRNFDNEKAAKEAMSVLQASLNNPYD